MLRYASRLAFLTELAVAFCTPSALATDAYFLRFNVTQNGTYWADDILFFNENSSPVSVRLLGVSNGDTPTNVPDLLLPPRRVVSGSFAFISEAPIWILHLDVPDGVIVQSRDEFGEIPGIPELFPISLGHVEMPVFRKLVRANEAQVHLGTDLSGIPSHINVVVYNAGAEPATAMIEVRRGCDDKLVDSRTVVIPANTVIQSGGLSTAADPLCPLTSSPVTAQPWVCAVKVTVDQPSLSLVSNVINANRLPAVGIAVSQSEHF